MSKDNPKLRKNGGEGTAVGNFLRSINFSKVSEVVGSVLSGDIKGAIQTLSNSEELSAEQLKMALKELEFDVIEMQEVTKRWEADLHSDSWLSKNIRPLTLSFLLACMFVFVILDSSLEGFEMNPEWISLLKGLLMTAVGGYFVVRSGEKIINKVKQK